ncbi:MAG: hypothetical protein KJ578_03740 [Bacteroidetes bacterium]|nr:hypothetical protein [Bacteroidota bacterium]MBU1578708.1 hypothetical protein [Bacteroidota bacterium]MBU2556873.1 hypothetical protein [Bacteroidota bacterium]
MIAINQAINLKNTIISASLDILALAFIYFTPALSHMFQLPIYLIEPMRLALILALVHTNKKNAYLLALTLPMFSFMISGHPVFIKTILISLELSLNVFLFYYLTQRSKNLLFAVLGSIIISKIVYYLLKYGLLQMLLLDGELVSTPLLIQLITSLVFSFYCFVLLKRQKV